MSACSSCRLVFDLGVEMTGSKNVDDAASFSVQAPQPVELDMSPIEVAAGLQHLPGVVFFDTSGNIPSRSHAPVSIIAARPVETIQGQIDNDADVERLRAAVGQWNVQARSLGFPAGGACGWVDYEGGFCFGIYPEMLIYQHDREQWWQCGISLRAFKNKQLALTKHASVALSP